MSENLDLDSLRRLISEDEIDTVLVAFPDMQGRLVGKRVTGHYFVDQAAHGLHVCDYLLAADIEMEPVPGFKAASWDLGYGDFTVRPDPATLRLVPWLPKTALILADALDHHGEDLPHAPRAILKRQIERAKEAGFIARLGSELEFYLFDESYKSTRQKGYGNVETSGWYIEDYHIFQTTKNEPLIRAIRNGMDAAGVPIEFSKGEWGPGQQEINLVYADALETADRHTIYKNGVKEIAFQHEKSVTFMAKFRQDLAGNSCHIHSSLWSSEDGSSAFASDLNGPEMSDTFQHYLAGQLKLAREATYFLAPYVNSYKRFQSGSFAPTKIVWSRDNRTAGFRVIGAGPSLRVECRIPGGDINPYLAFAVTIAAGLYGIEHQLELEDAFDGNAYEDSNIPEVPKTLTKALDALDDSKVLRDLFGDDIVDHYVHAGRWEQSQYDQAVTDWERARYFERI